MFRVTRVWLVLSAMGFLAACGGGYGDSVQDDSRRISGVAQLGYIQSGIVELYEVSDLVNPLAVAETSNSVSGADLGAFSISLPAGLSSPMYVIKVSGGTDLDPDDNGEIDISAGVKNRGSFYGLIPSENLDGTVRVTALSDLIYRSTPKQNLGDGATASGIAEKLLNDLDGDGRVDLGDVLAFDPLRHVDQLKVSYDDLLKAYVGLIHRGDQQSGLAKRALEFVDYEPEPPGPLYAEVGAVITFPEQALPRGLVTEWTMDDQVVTGGATLSRVGSTSIALEIKHGEHRVAQYFWDAVAYEASELGHVDADPGSVSLLDVTNEQSDSLAGFELLVPAGAVDKPVTIVASELESDGKAVLGVPLSKAIELLPAGTQFAKPVLVSMPFRPEGVNSSDVIVTRVNDDGSVDSLVPESVDIDRGLVSFRTEHFSKYQINKDVQNNFDNLTSFAYDESQVESFVSELLILLEGAPDVSYDSDDLQPYREMSAEEWLRLLSVDTPLAH